MRENVHKQAELLLAQRHIENISSEEQMWLNAHLAECEACSASDAETSKALAALRSVQIELPKNLASRTQLRVRMRAEELRGRAPGRSLLWAITGVSWMLGVASAPFVWRGFEWAGGELGLPTIVWQSGVVLWWLVPGLLAAGAVVMQRRGVAREAE